VTAALAITLPVDGLRPRRSARVAN